MQNLTFRHSLAHWTEIRVAELADISTAADLIYLQEAAFHKKLQFPRVSEYKPILYREIIAVCSQIHTKHINILWVKSKIYEF
jgi:hypothetical protein